MNLIDPSSVEFDDSPTLLGTRSDGVGIWRVGESKGQEIVVLSKSKPTKTDENLTPLDSVLRFTDPDSIDWVDE
ncbi:hypothetical protein [Pantanalinema sp. GBBB05]|uniref:hypothetical protein n=1 Tax=Pantanalinema sp. GBBB05 TaxID=2604139 RepID=UPI001DCFE4DC|nr:hypothetical protein [Pantanalinema sp. GBBB05]